MLVVVKDRNFHALAQFALDDKTIGRLDVFEVDAAKGRFQRGNDFHQLVRVFFIDFDVEHIDAGEFLEQHALAFHHRLAGQRPDVAQSQHGRAIGDHAYQVAACGVAEGCGRILHDFFAWSGHAGRIGQRQIVLVDELLGGFHADLAGAGIFVVIKRGLAQLGASLGLWLVLVGAGGFGSGHECS